MRWLSQISVFGFLLTLGTVHAIGQATAAASGGNNQAYASGMFTINRTDYNAPFTYGGTFGADYRSRNLRFGQAAIASRFSFVPDKDVVSENSYLFGPEWHMHAGRLQPYVNLHIGYATISYGKRTQERESFGVSSRSGVAYEFGGGVDYRLAHNYGIRLGDFQYQNWKMGRGSLFRQGKPPIVNGEITYSPYQISTGFYYRFY